MNQKLIQLNTEIESTRLKLVEHPLYVNLNSLQTIRFFMEQHVFAVWDFMSLLKALQRELTSVEIPWTPTSNPSTRRLINEIVLGEESDIDENGRPSSHFELYLEAMKEINAETSHIEGFVNERNWQNINNLAILEETKQFVNFTFDIIKTGQLHLIASVFTFGREDLIPDMFIEIVKEVEKESNQSFKKLVYYLQRHIEIDGGEHGPLSLNMIQELCGDDNRKWEEATIVAKQAIDKRILLWDGILKNVAKSEQLESCTFKV